MSERNQLFFGDNLQVLRDSIGGKGLGAVVAEEPEAEYGYGEAQITAFEDTWHWGQHQPGAGSSAKRLKIS